MAITGPITPAVLITEVSIAYALRIKSSETIAFHSGRTERLIGGAEIPNRNAKLKIVWRVWAKLRTINIDVYPGTKILRGHFWPKRSMTEDRIPAEAEPATEVIPMARPAKAIEPVSCWALKKTERAIIP